MIKAIFFFSGCLVFTGCKVLSKQEMQSVQSLSAAINTCSKLPSDFTKQYYDLTFDTRQLDASEITNPTDKITMLDELLKDRRQGDTIVAKYIAGYAVLNKYAELLGSLTDSSYLKALGKQKDAFIPTFDTAVSRYNSVATKKLPVASLGGLITGIIQEAGNRRIRYLQRKYLKNAVNAADSAVGAICDEYVIIDDFIQRTRLSNLGATISQSYKNFMNAISLNNQQVNAFTYYQNFDPIYLNWKNKEASLQALNKTSVAALNKVKVTHHKLKDYLNKKADWKYLGKQLKELYSSISSLQESYQKFTKDLKPKN